MAIEVGKYISESLSEYITRWTNTYEYRDIAIHHDQSDELARKIVSRNRKVTESNLPMVHDILKLAIENRNQILPTLKKGHKEAVQSLQKVTA